jgi:hypothetical protein
MQQLQTLLTVCHPEHQHISGSAGGQFVTCEIIWEQKDLAICNSMARVYETVSRVTRFCLLGVLLPHH